MKAVRIHSFGPPEVLQLEEVSQPAPSSGELLIKIAAAGINPVDYKIRQGGYPRVTQSQLPITLGRDICGRVEQSSDGDPPLELGQWMYALLDWRLGGYAEYVTVPRSLCVPMPASLSPAQAAAVPLAALTAWQGIFDCGRLASGQSILIHGGAGGVGHFAIQLAKSRGARVLTTVSASDMEFVTELGADLVIDRKAQRFEDVVSNVDVVYDLIGGDTRERSWNVLKRGGIMVSTLGKPDEARAVLHGVRVFGYTAQPSQEQLLHISELLVQGQLKVYLNRTFELREAAAAHHFLETAHPRGKIAFIVGT
jgi:NADPH:quinone reductase-like Zn-dependent oxidoreductase